MFGVLLVLMQAVAVVLLTISGLRPTTRDRWLYLVLGTALLLGTSGADRYLSQNAAKQERETLEQRIEQLYRALSTLVMNFPKVEGPPTPTKPTAQIQLLEPPDGSRVPSRQLVTGIADASLREVRVVIHPLDTGAYWVQPVPATAKDGRWSVLGYFGRSGDIDVGKVFEVVAFGDPEHPLDEGTVLGGWPKAAQRSAAIGVTRQ